MRHLIKDEEIAAKPYIFDNPDVREGIKNALKNLGWMRGGAIMPHMGGPVGYEVFLSTFEAIVNQAVRRSELAIDHAWTLAFNEELKRRGIDEQWAYAKFPVHKGYVVQEFATTIKTGDSRESRAKSTTK